MGKAKRERRLAVIAGTEMPIRQVKWQPTPKLIHPAYPNAPKVEAVIEEDEVWKQRKEVTKDVPTDS